MNFYHISLLLLVVLSVDSGSPQHVKSPDPPDPIGVTVCQNSSSSQSGPLAPVLPQNEVFRVILPHSGVFILPQNEVFVSALPQHEVFRIVLPHNGVFALPQIEVFMSALPQNEVFMSTLPKNGVYKSVMPQNEFKFVAVTCRLSCNMKNFMYFVLDVQVKTFRFCAWFLLHGIENVGYMIRNLKESLQHVLKMYAWSLSENQASVKFRCRLMKLFLQQSLFRKHDFAVLVYKLYLGCQKRSSWHIKTIFSDREYTDVEITICIQVI
jgi:hypothetical protein